MKKEQNMFERKTIIKGIILLLTIFEHKQFNFEEQTNIKCWDDWEKNVNDWGVIKDRTYIIKNNNIEIYSQTLKSDFIKGANDKIIIQKEDIDKYVSFEEMGNSLNELYKQFPYLKPIMQLIEQICIKKDDLINETDILNAARTYVDSTIKSNPRRIFLNKIIPIIPPKKRIIKLLNKNNI